MLKGSSREGPFRTDSDSVQKEYWDLGVEILVQAYGLDNFGFSTDETGISYPVCSKFS